MSNQEIEDEFEISPSLVMLALLAILLYIFGGFQCHFRCESREIPVTNAHPEKDFQNE